MATEHCSIIKKLHLCACARLISRSLCKIGAEIAVLSWNLFYCQGTTALYHNQETAPLRMRQTEFALYGKLGAEFTVFSWKHSYCQGTTALFHNQETAILRIFQTKLSFSWQDRR
jgi:hypothetical protein